MTIRRDLTHVKSQVDALHWVKAQRKMLKEVEDAARPVVENALAGADEGIIDGRCVVRLTEVKSRRLDQKALKLALPDILEEYMTTGVANRLDIVADDEDGDRA